MDKYRVVKIHLKLYTAEGLEKKLNEIANEGYDLLPIFPHVEDSYSFIFERKTED
jgi:hypothetical protein